ncbi:MAG: Translation initiation factor IF-2 [Alphaproteobacteria bacterium MarineAlpha5_Bin12]|nr:translation initiation factor IF-2 [Pelagibacteraceae bacterium]PPR41173.1 MAG: Translation initiation factor IF-2 [Alphaproteobacteria bacterium MarineAlpha5_Bin12]
MDKNKKDKKPLKLSSEGRLQLRKNLGPDQVKRQSSNKKSKTIQIVFKKKTSSKTDSSFSKRQVFSKRPEKRQETNQNNIKGKKFNKLFTAPILTKSDVHKKIDTKKFDNKKTNTKKIKRTLNPDDKVGKFDVNKVLQQEEQEYDKLPSLAKIKRAREREKLKTQSLDNTKLSRDVTIPEIITVQDLANRMAEKTADVVKELMKLGIMVTANQSIEGDTAELVATELGHKSNRVSDIDVLKDIEDIEDPEDELQSRPPVVTIMGHVDHGKTSILDSIRKSDVASKEAGGITQHIGAYQITTEKDKKITFIDTPGHEAFTNIRARGAKTTDIVVLVIAADDGIKPQTQEAISHAKAAKVPIIIAINKIDTPGANPEKVRTELLSYEIVVEKLSGEVQDVEVSATKNMNIDKLQEAILLQAEILNLKANPNRKSRGVVLESRLEKGRGPVATILIQKGTLKIGDVFVSGSEWGKIRALRNDKGEKEETALPGSPIEILGLNDNPQAGDDFIVVNSEFTAREIAKYRLSEKKKNLTINKSNVENMFEKIAAGEISKLPVIVKADVQGSADAIDSSLEKLSTNEVKTDVIFKGVGAITESDVALANSSKGFIIGFNVRAIPQARDMAKREGVDLKYYSVIYELIDDVKKLMGGLLSPNISEKITGNVEIREVFKISKIGNVAGCFVKEGFIKRDSKIRILRDNVVVHEGKIDSLKRFKDEVKDVQQGYECGVTIEEYNDIKKGDIIETFLIQKEAREL